jgi:hypothetical protein
MTQLFISHSSQDDGFVRGLQQELADLGQDVWIDSREMRGGALLWPEIQRAIEGASAYAVVVSPDALQSEWVGKELRYALTVQQQRRGRLNLLHQLQDRARRGARALDGALAPDLPTRVRLGRDAQQSAGGGGRNRQARSARRYDFR